jgi:hypothetical protein
VSKLRTLTHDRLSRDSWHGQRIGDALAVSIDEGVIDGLVERGDVCEGLGGARETYPLVSQTESA